MDDFESFRKNIKDISLKDAQILAQRVWILSRVKEGIFEKTSASPQTGDYSYVLRITSPDGKKIYELTQKEMGPLSHNYYADILAKKVKDLEHSLTSTDKIIHITREMESDRTIANSLRGLIKDKTEVTNDTTKPKSKFLSIGIEKE